MLYFSPAVKFCCCKCGSHHFVKVEYNGLPSSDFYSGYYMCKTCGTSLSSNNERLSYYSPEFAINDYTAVQLSLF